MAEFLFRQVEMSASNINHHMDLLAALYPDKDPPYANTDDLYATVDATQAGDAPWSSFKVSYTGHIPEENPPCWKTATYEVWHRDVLTVMEHQLGSADFVGEIDYAPKRVFSLDGRRQYMDLMSGNWAWQQAVSISPALLCHAPC
jgi:Plavaka transposase